MIISIIRLVTFYLHIWICGHMGTFRRRGWLGAALGRGIRLSSAVFWSVERNPLTGEHVASLVEVKCKNGLSQERGFGPSPSMTF